MQAEKNTPLMQQYHDIKREYPDALLFFQVGDFYELFFDDAKVAASFLGIALTSRGKHDGEPIPLCGVPLHAKDHYVHKLIKGGFKVALCDQLEEAVPGKLVRRAVAQVMTPGTITDSQLLDEKSASYLFSFYPSQNELALVFSEILTAQLWATIVPINDYRIVESELARFFPDELLIPDTRDAKPWISFFKKLGYFTTIVQPDAEEQHTFLQEWISCFTADVQQCITLHAALKSALFYFYAYVKKTQQTSLAHLNQLVIYQPDDFLIMDASTQRNLELIRNQYDGGGYNTLFHVLDGAATPMGSRMIKKWIARPLVKKEAIMERLDVVGAFSKDVVVMQTLQQLLVPIGDIERVIGRIVLGRAHLHDYCALKRCLAMIPLLKKHISSYSLALLTVIANHCGDFSSLAAYLDQALPDDPMTSHLIKHGFDKQLDYMRELIAHSNEKLLALEKEEIAKTGIQSLKIRYNNVYGYYIEVTNPNKDLVPERYIRRQTLVGKERYVTAELQQLAYEIERAHAHIQDREKMLFETVKQNVAQWNTQLRRLSHALAHLDGLHGLAKVAYNNGYTRPEFHDNRDIVIAEGRHPVVERNSMTTFIPNDTLLTDEQSLVIITGPNMGGKSTYLRQTALLCIIAQCGSFVPARMARLPVLDRLFTRIGAGDNLAAGKSTFLVEMEETASICLQATPKSLIILDEVGRGTSTFDGLAIAQAVIEYLFHQVKARCLFATHYHELTALSTLYPAIASFHAASKKTEMGIIFLYKIVHGVADGSFGIEVAKLAQIPRPIVERAEQLLEQLVGKQQKVQKEEPGDQDQSYHTHERGNKRLHEPYYDAIVNQLATANLDTLSPKQVFDMVWQWKQLLR